MCCPQPDLPQACAEAGVMAGEPLSENGYMLTSALSVNPASIKKVGLRSLCCLVQVSQFGVCQFGFETW